jgi:hypothetical protein
MNGRRARYSSLAAVSAVAIAGFAATGAVAEPTPQPAADGVTASALTEAGKTMAAPTFASIPPAPKDLRPFRAWRAAIAETKGVGAATLAEAQAGPWTLDGTEAWAARARAAAAPPPPMTPAESDTQAFVRDMIRRATPPPRAR